MINNKVINKNTYLVIEKKIFETNERMNTYIKFFRLRGI